MIALVLVVLTFVLLGLGVVALAMRSGRRTGPPGGGGRRGRGPSRGAVVGFTIVALAFGVGVPALVMAYNGGNQSKVAPGGLELTASQQHGRQLFTRNCGSCHTLAAANGVGKVGPVLDDIIPKIADEKARVAFIDDAIKNGRARGNGQMPKGVVDGQDAEDVASFVAVSAGR